MRAPWHRVGFGCKKPLTSARALVSRRATIVSGASALVAACALAACGADPEPDGVGADLKPETVSVLAPHANTELGNLIDGAPELIVAGERLNVGLLRRFYARHDFEPGFV